MGGGASVPPLHLPHCDSSERMHHVKCNCCSKDIVGTKWKERNSDFCLCDVCYTQRDGVVDNSSLVPIFVTTNNYGNKILGSAKLTPRNVSSAKQDPLQNRMTYSSIMKALPTDIVEKERRSKTELLNNCPPSVAKAFNKSLGLFPAYAIPHGMDEDLWDLTEGCDWKVYLDGDQAKYFLEMNQDLLGTLNMLMMDRSYGNLARLRILAGFCIAQHETPAWLRLFATRWLPILQVGAEAMGRSADSTGDELSRRQYFSHRCLPLNYEMKNVPGGMKNSVLPGFMSVQFTENAKVRGKQFYDSCLFNYEQPWFFSSQFSNSEYSAQLEHGSPLQGTAELVCRFDANFPNAKKFVQMVQPLIGSQGCDLNTAINYDFIATAKLVRTYVDELMEAGLKRLRRVSPTLRYSKAPIIDGPAMALKGKARWEESGRREGTLNMTDVIQYRLELTSFDLSLRLCDVLHQKLFKKHLHLKTEVNMAAGSASNIKITFGVRLREIASNFPFFEKLGIFSQIGADQFVCVQVLILQKDMQVMAQYISQLKELSEKDFISTDSPIRDLASHLDEIGHMAVDNRKSFFSKPSEGGAGSLRKLFSSFSSGGSGQSGELDGSAKHELEEDPMSRGIGTKQLSSVKEVEEAQHLAQR